ncbi:hypothetical protein L4D76_01685 [Photobacterium sagamiensis]|uniref:hypothetical protein n=1 Tax=Photobacterium sagamiensis TaxID=2910241 RepID=UPI003D14DCDB
MTNDMDTLQCSFIEIAERINAKLDFKPRRCLDNRVLEAQYMDGRWTTTTTFVRSIFLPSEKPNLCIFLILESPHYDEFLSNPPMPAAGTTGDYIEEHLEKVLNTHVRKPKGLEEGTTFDVVLMNAVQFQTSLGVSPPSVYRDDVFRPLWRRGGNEDFRTRLADNLEQGDIIINACTSGKKPRDNQIKLRESVEIVVQSVASKCGNSTYRVEHPINWGRIVNTANKYETELSFAWQSLSDRYIELTGQN